MTNPYDLVRRCATIALEVGQQKQIQAEKDGAPTVFLAAVDATTQDIYQAILKELE